MLLVGFEPTISAVERPQTYAFDRTANGTGYIANFTYTIFIDLNKSPAFFRTSRCEMRKNAGDLPTSDDRI